MPEEKELLTSLQHLPEPIKEVVHDFYKTATRYQGNDPHCYHMGEACVNYLEKVLPAFTDTSVKEVWTALLNSKAHNSDLLVHYSPEEKAKKVAQALLYMENCFESVQDSHSNVKTQIKYQKKFLGLIQKAIEIKKASDPYQCSNDDDLKNLDAIEKKQEL